MRVSVFCASGSKINPVYFKDAACLARILAEKEIAANYGGGQVGLMGEFADTMMAHGGSLRGIIPEFMVRQGWQHPKLQDMIVVKGIHERMKRIHQNVDGYIALPGGVGTLTELLETITMKQLGQIHQPIVILNTNQYFDPFLQMLEKMIKEHFFSDLQRDIWSVVSKPEEVLDAIMVKKNIPG